MSYAKLYGAKFGINHDDFTAKKGKKNKFSETTETTPRRTRLQVVKYVYTFLVYTIGDQFRKS